MSGFRSTTVESDYPRMSLDSRGFRVPSSTEDEEATYGGSDEGDATGLSNPIERFLVGSVSAAVAARASCSVEVVRLRNASL